MAHSGPFSLYSLSLFIVISYHDIFHFARTTLFSWINPPTKQSERSTGLVTGLLQLTLSYGALFRISRYLYGSIDMGNELTS